MLSYSNGFPEFDTALIFECALRNFISQMRFEFGSVFFIRAESRVANIRIQNRCGCTRLISQYFAKRDIPRVFDDLTGLLALEPEADQLRFSP